MASGGAPRSPKQSLSLLQVSGYTPDTRCVLLILSSFRILQWKVIELVGRPWPRGHNLKSLALAWKVNFLVLASKPASPRKCHVLGSRTALFFDLLKMGQGHDHFCFLSRSTPETSRNIYEDLFSLENARIFAENLRFFCAKTFFFGEHLRVVSLASRGSVLGKSVLDFGLEPCVLYSTSAYNNRYLWQWSCNAIFKIYSCSLLYTMKGDITKFHPGCHHF